MLHFGAVTLICSPSHTHTTRRHLHVSQPREHEQNLKGSAALQVHVQQPFKVNVSDVLYCKTKLDDKRTSL